jgi:uncharacterized protein
MAVAAAINPRKTVWVDLDNSPHVPLFAPIIKELERRGYAVLVTARDCFQVCDLANLLEVRHRPIGRHYGKHGLLKAAGLCFRALQLAPTIWRNRPALAISHGSRSQLLLSALMRLPSIVMIDYEFARGLTLMRPGWAMLAEPIPEASVGLGKERILKYPGIKEDVYVPNFRPDPSIQAELGIGGDVIAVTIRPPANEAHYYCPESDALFRAVLEMLSHRDDVRIILLPRNRKQEEAIREGWPALFASGKMKVPDRAVDGLNLIWHSDLVISGGGTMNREAAALGVPVYSIFRGKIGAVDRYLAQAGRLVLVESREDVGSKIVLRRRTIPSEPRANGGPRALTSIVDSVAGILESFPTR